MPDNTVSTSCGPTPYAADEVLVQLDDGVETPRLALSSRVLDAAPVGMFLTAPSGTVLWANASAGRIVGRHPAALRGSSLWEFVAATEVAAGSETMEQLLHGEVDQAEREECWRRADGSTIWVQASTSVATDADGLPLRVGAANERCLIRQVVDITARRVAESALASTRVELERRNAELQRSNDELSEFGYVVSHDLSEPLRVIAGHVQLLAARYGDRLGRDADEWIAFAVDGCTRMRTLIDDLLDYSRAGRDLQNRRPVDAQRAAGDACAALAAAIDEAGAIVDVGELPTVYADATQLGQIFTNLIGNAIKFRRAGVRPHVAITARDDGTQWHFTVSDNGIGIPERHRQRVFKLFQKLAPPGEYSGTGIGLAICRKVVEHFGGRIWIEDAPEGGSAFHFTIPQQGDDATNSS